MGMLRSIGIRKGEALQPDGRQKSILVEAAFVGEAMARANSYRKRIEKPYFKARKWVQCHCHEDASKKRTTYTDR